MQHAQMDNCLTLLSLHRIREIYIQEAENAANTKLSYQDYLLRLVEQQVLAKIDRSINCKTQRAAFPQIKRLEEFDFSLQPKINEQIIRELATLEFLNDAKNVLFIGAPGVFCTAELLTQELAAAEVSGRLNKLLEQLARLDLLIIDELGYLSLTKQTAKLFFQLISKRYEKGSIIITANKPFEQFRSLSMGKAFDSKPYPQSTKPPCNAPRNHYHTLLCAFTIGDAVCLGDFEQ